MKRIFLMVMAALFGMATVVQAQVKIDEEAFKKRETKSNADIQNAKKNVKAATWVDRGKLYYEAATQPSTGLYPGMTEKEVELLFGKPQKKTEKVGDVSYASRILPYFTAYLKDGKVEFWLVTKEIIPDALGKSFEAYGKAYELDNASKAVRDGMDQLANAYKQDAQNLFAYRNYKEAAAAFANAAQVQQHPALNVVDTLSMFNAGFLYTMSEDYPNAQKYLEQALKYGYENNGDIFYMLYYSYNSQNMPDKAKQILYDGLEKYPDNTTIVEYLVNHYTVTGEDPKAIIPIVEKSIQDNPENANLWASLGRVYDKLGEIDKSVEAFEKVAQMRPDEFSSQYNLGLLYVKKADEMYNKLNDTQFTSQKAYNDALAEVLTAYGKSVDPLEKALPLAPDEKADPKRESYLATVELLKNITFRLRDQPGMKEKHEKYNEIFKASQQ